MINLQIHFIVVRVSLQTEKNPIRNNVLIDELMKKSNGPEPF